MRGKQEGGRNEEHNSHHPARDLPSVHQVFYHLRDRLDTARLVHVVDLVQRLPFLPSFSNVPILLDQLHQGPPVSERSQQFAPVTDASGVAEAHHPNLPGTRHELVHQIFLFHIDDSLGNRDPNPLE